MTRDTIFTEAFEEQLKDFLACPKGAAKDQLKNQLVKHCWPYVQKIAKGIARRQTDPVDDLIQVGCLGLVKALDKYNPLAGTSFKTYSTYLITGEIRHYLRDKAQMIKAPRQMYELYYRMNQIVQRLSDELGRTPTDAEIAETLECPVETIQNILETDRRRTMVSLDQFVSGLDGSGGETVYVERLVDDKYTAFLQNQENKLVLESALARLKDEHKQVVKMTYYEDMSQMEIAKILGISQMQVSRRLRKALDLLQTMLGQEVFVGGVR